MPFCSFDPSSQEYADFIESYSVRSLDQLYRAAQTDCVSLISQEFAVIHRPLSQALPISLARYSYSSIPKLYSLLDTTALEAAGITQPLEPQSAGPTGQGILIGFIDTGIDYTNPLFRFSDGTSRILGIWDQTIPLENGSLPQGVAGFQPFYGAVYTQQQINEALLSPNPLELVPTKDSNGHGTFAAGIAAGGRIQRPVSFSGASPDCLIAAVRLKPAKEYLKRFFLVPSDADAYQENDIMAAVSYLLGLANQHSMPLVLYFGVGTSQGSHDGTSPLCLQLQSLAGGKALTAVAGAGNEGGYHHHYLGKRLENQEEYEDIELRVGPDETGFCAELWAGQPELYTVGFVTPSGETIGRIPAGAGAEAVVPLRAEGSSVTVSYKTAEGGSGSQLIFMRFERPAPGIWHIRVYPLFSISGEFHVWLPQHPFLSPQTEFLRPNPDTTVTDPGNAAMPLTVSAYSHTADSLYIHSSRGYTRSQRVKPDLAAPGVQVQGPASSEGSGPDPVFTRRSGTSVAAAIAAGAAANVLSWAFISGNDPSLTGASVKSILQRGAKRSPAYLYPNRQWGYGTLDLYQAFQNHRGAD